MIDLGAKKLKDIPASPKLIVQSGGVVNWQRRGGGTPTLAYLKVPTAGQLLQMEVPERRLLLRPWFRQQESVLLYSATGVGKSFFALSVAIAVAGGGQLLGWDVEPSTRAEGWRVMYVDGEMHLGDLQARVRGLLAGAIKVDREAVLRNLSLLSRQGQNSEAWFPSLTDPEGVAFYRELVEQSKVDVIVFDNFSTLGEVEDENSASSFNAVTSTLLSLKQLGVATVLVHHTGKDAKTYRGSSKLAATFEVILRLDGTHKEVQTEANQAELTADATEALRSAAFLTTFEKLRSGTWPSTVGLHFSAGMLPGITPACSGSMKRRTIRA